MKKLLILVLTNFFILSLILFGEPVKAQTTTITGQFLYGLELYVLPEKQTPPDYSTAIYSSTIDENDFITSGLYENWLQPRLPDEINGYIYLVDSTHTIGNVYLGGGYLEQGQTLSYPYEPSIELKHYGAQLIDIFVLNPVNKYYYEAYGGRLDYIVYFENNDGSTPRIKLIDATTNENDYNRVKLTINGYDTGYNAGYSIGYNNGQVNGYNNGYEDGQNNGYNAGYNAGQYDFFNEYYQQIYDDGYNAGLGERQFGVNTVINFNQLARFTSNYIPSAGANITYNSYNDVGCKLNGISNESISRTGWFGLDTYAFIQNHIYYVKSTYISGEYNNIPKISLSNSALYDIGTSFIYNNIYSTNSLTLNISINSSYNDYIFTFIVIDLTSIYGSGNENTNIGTLNNIFPSPYYDYTTSSLINIGYENGFITGKKEGVAIGYDEGKSYQATQQLTSDGWIKNIFTGIGSFLALEILPNVSIGLIVGIPFIISVAWFVIKMARGGGNN